MKILFVCTLGISRSKTAEVIFRDQYETRSRGIYGDENPLKKEDLEWANIVIVMKERHRKAISENFPQQYLKKKILVLDIPDVYQFNQAELIRILKDKVPKALA
jgi:predicted protein tyrosine phosphatase